MEQTNHQYHGGLIGAQPAPPEAIDSTKLYRREGGFPVGWLIAPSVIWLLIFLVLPLLGILVFSFWKFTGYGMSADFVIQNFVEFFGVQAGPPP